MKKIKAVTVEFDNGTRVGYENWPEAENVSQSFKVGDLVKYQRGSAGDALINRIGVIRHIDGTSVGVEWAGYTGGHNLNGLTHRHNTGWVVFRGDLEHA